MHLPVLLVTLWCNVSYTTPCYVCIFQICSSFCVVSYLPDVPGRRLSEAKPAEKGGYAPLLTTKYEPDMDKTDRNIEVGNRMEKTRFLCFWGLRDTRATGICYSDVHQIWHVVREFSNEHYIKNRHFDLICVTV